MISTLGHETLSTQKPSETIKEELPSQSTKTFQCKHKQKRKQKTNRARQQHSNCAATLGNNGYHLEINYKHRETRNQN